MRIPLTIETHDRRLAFDIAAVGNTLKAGSIVEVPGGTKVQFQSMYGRKAFGVPETLEFIVDASKTIDIGLFAAWLYDKVKDRPVEKLTIRRREITEITEDNIRRVLEEEIEIDG